MQAAIDTVLSQLGNEIAEYTQRAVASLQAGKVDDAVHELLVITSYCADAAIELLEAPGRQRALETAAKENKHCSACGFIRGGMCTMHGRSTPTDGTCIEWLPK
jgi:hypothetical protein